MIPRILILTHRNLNLAPRVIRAVRALNAINEVGEVLLIAQSATAQLPNQYYSIYTFRTLWDKAYSRIQYFFSTIFQRTNPVPRYSKLRKFIYNQRIDVLIIHEPEFVHFALRLKAKYGMKVIFNAHEFHPLEFENDPKWYKKVGRYYHSLYQNELKQVDLLINVCEGIRQRCISDYDLQSIVIPNAAPRFNLIPSTISGEPIRLVHHGALLPGRNLEKMIHVMDILGSGYDLSIIGLINPAATTYYAKIKALCDERINCHLIEPTNYDNIVPNINKFDLGFYLLEPSSFNNYYALPNKLFEFIQARLAIAISPSPEMSKIVEKYSIGIVSEDFTAESMAKAIQSIDIKQLETFKANTMIAAQNENAEQYHRIFVNEILNLVNHNNQ